MVNQNFILYINSKKVLKTVPLKLSTRVSCSIYFCIPEDHLICGLIFQGVPIKGEKLRDFPLKPVEKYLFEFSNIHFLLSENEFTIENTCYNWKLDLSLNPWINLLPPPVPLPVFVISDFWTDTALKINASGNFSESDTYQLVKYDSQGVRVDSYILGLSSLQSRLIDGVKYYYFPISLPYSGNFEIHTQNGVKISNRYGIPQ